jgi:xylan 1,4-beta-xylosidase
MPKRVPLLCCIICTLATTGCATWDSLWQQTYRNPIITQHDLADPDVLKVGETYYLYGTTHGRGYDVFVSDDLVHWENKGLAFDDPRGGAWAPDLFHDARGDGKYYLYYTDSVSAGSNAWQKQIGVAVAGSPLGPFIDAGVLAVGCIDAHLFQDDDGKYYLYYVANENGFKIFARAMATPLQPHGEPVAIIQPTDAWEVAGDHVTEAPFMLKRDDTYYLMYSGSGADSYYYAIGYATASSPLGPFVKYPGNPIVRAGANVIGPGHPSVVEGPDEQLWMLYHQKRTPDLSWPRFLALDPLWFDEKGAIHATVSHGTEQAAP